MCNTCRPKETNEVSSSVFKSNEIQVKTFVKPTLKCFTKIVRIVSLEPKKTSLKGSSVFHRPQLGHLIFFLHTCIAQSFDFQHVVLYNGSNGSLQRLFNIFPRGQKWPCQRTHFGLHRLHIRKSHIFYLFSKPYSSVWGPKEPAKGFTPFSIEIYQKI